MGEGKVIRLNAATWARVAVLMEKHGATAGEVLVMGLETLDGNKAPALPVRGRWAGRTVVAQRALQLPILEVLWRHGGEAPVAMLRRRLEELLDGYLGEDDRRVLASGQPRWWNAVCWERLAMVKAGLLEAKTRGVWRLTAAGRATYLAR